MDDQLTKFKLDISQVLKICYNILNASRDLDDLSFQIDLLAINGSIHASRLDQAVGLPLVVLATELSKISQQITPQMNRLGKVCDSLSYNMAFCSLVVRRYFLYTESISNCLIRINSDRNISSTEPSSDLQLSIAQWNESLANTLSQQLKPVDFQNLEFLVEMGRSHLKQINSLLHESLKQTKNAERCLQRIEKIAVFTSCTATCMAINTAYLHEGADHFYSLSREIREIMKHSKNLHAELSKQIQQASSLLTNLIQQEHSYEKSNYLQVA